MIFKLVKLICITIYNFSLFFRKIFCFIITSHIYKEKGIIEDKKIYECIICKKQKFNYIDITGRKK